MTEQNIQEIKNAIREFFVESYNHLTNHDDIKVAIERSFRYQELLGFYMFSAQRENTLLRLNAEEILQKIKQNTEKDREYILTGRIV